MVIEGDFSKSIDVSCGNLHQWMNEFLHQPSLIIIQTRNEFILIASSLYRIFDEQVKLMEQGFTAEKAYQTALSSYRSARKRQELTQRVAQEQFLEIATVPSSYKIEEFLREEKEVLSAEAVRKTQSPGNK